MSYSIIAAIGKNNELGYNNHLIWYLKKDLVFFRNTTMNKTIVMGSNTFHSLPKMLPDREHVVLSSKNDYPEGVVVYNNIEDFLKDYNNRDEEIFIIGGASIYRQFIDLCDKLYLTRIDDTCPNADVYFPEFNEENYDVELLGEESENNIDYKHLLYRKK